MLCARCGTDNCVCIDTRLRQSGTRRRRYKCQTCDHRFTTVELYAADYERLVNSEERYEAVSDTLRNFIESVGDI